MLPKGWAKKTLTIIYFENILNTSYVIYTICILSSSLKKEGVPMSVVRLLRSGQVTIPTKIRNALNLRKGAFLEVMTKNNRIILTPKKLANKDEAKEKVFTIVEKIWARNKDVDPEQVGKLVEKAVRAIRADKQK